MKILHVCNIEHENSNGIAGIVPQYVEHQAKYAKVDLLNLQESNKIKKNEKYDLVIIHGVYELNTLVFFYRYIYKKYKYVFVPHGGLTTISQKKSKIKKLVANKILFRKFYKFAEAIQFLTENEKNNSIDVKNENLIICRSGIDLPDTILYQPHFRNEIRFVYIGRITIYYKGLDLLLKSLVHIKDELHEKNVKLKIIGVNNDNEPLDKLYKIINDYSLENLVTIDLDGRFGEDKRKELLEADYFIQTSRSEGLPLGVLEAMSYGIPLAITDPVGLSDLVEKYHCGFHCKAEEDAIASMIKKCISESKLSNMSLNAYKAAMEYDWETVTQKTLENYLSIIKGNRY